MELKDYQNETLQALERYTQTLRDVQEETERKTKVLEAGGYSDEGNKYNTPELAWEKIGKKNYVSRTSSSKTPIPHVCLKVPTGGGKTLLAVAAIKHLIEKKTGLVFWVIPTSAIYMQTVKAFQTRAHPYRRKLEHISGGKIKLFKKGERLTTRDIKNHLCLVVYMHQSTSRKKGKKEIKFPKDNSFYSSFFPEQQNKAKSQELQQRYPDLDTNAQGKRVRRSLLNVLKMLRPVVILDEAHKIYGEKDKDSQEFVQSINRLNPRFVLELSATPKKAMSNILVEVSGTTLDKEEMIKMPIQIHNLKRVDWQETLVKAHSRLQQLDQKAQTLYSQNRRYIRPIALVRVERTGKNQRGQNKIHAEDVKEHLITRLSVPESVIRIQSAERKELKGENLMGTCCQVRWIITKDALKEGWDCSFAYILVLLDNTKASTALTQMVGRVLRQPHAQKIQSSDEDYDELNRCYVFYNRWEVGETLTAIAAGLQHEGLGDLKDAILPSKEDDEETADTEKTIVKRKKKYQNLDVFLPKVLHKNDEGDAQEWRLLNYERDILASLPWHKIAIDETRQLHRVENNHEDIREMDVQGEDIKLVSKPLPPLQPLQLTDFAHDLEKVVSNPWQAARIAKTFLARHRKEGYDEHTLDVHAKFLSSQLERMLQQEISKKAEKIFKKKVDNNIISFHLETNEQLTYKMNKSFEFFLPSTEHPLLRKDHTSLQRNLFEPLFTYQFNGLEESFALYLDKHDAIKWWHRVAVKQDYPLQGWHKGFIYPDFIAIRTEDQRLLIFETKGSQFKGSDDTSYKKDLLATLEKASKRAHNRGEMKTKSVTLRMLFDDCWQSDANKAIDKNLTP